VIPGMLAADRTRAQVLGQSAPVEWAQKGADLVVTAKSPLPAQFGVRLTPAPTARD